MKGEKLEEKGYSMESAFYGRAWDHAHHGYFSDPDTARAIVEAVKGAVELLKPDVLADIGGGTGFLLGRVRPLSGGARLVNVDPASGQLAACSVPGITPVAKPLEELARADLAGREETLLLMMRSLLHYFGKDRLTGALLRLREISGNGEYLVHQTACFQERGEADCLNRLYEEMRTGKWYTTAGEVHRILEGSGFRVEAVGQAPKLALDSAELLERYRVPEPEMKRISKRLAREFGEMPGCFEPHGGSFTAYLPYRVFTCRAVGEPEHRAV
jgi:hypothetical protein